MKHPNLLLYKEAPSIEPYQPDFFDIDLLNQDLFFFDVVEGAFSDAASDPVRKTRKREAKGQIDGSAGGGRIRELTRSRRLIKNRRRI